MNSSQFHAATLDILKNYWRIKAANALYRSSPDAAVGRLEYIGVPAVGVAANHFPSESVADAMSALDGFIARRLPRDLFLALISEFEGRIASRLVSIGESSEGTLGQLQNRIQAKITVPLTLVEDLNEIRERRNAMIHHGDKADAKYVAASAVVLPRANPYVKVTFVGDDVSPSESYLAYSVDVLVRYSNCVG